MKNLFHNKRIRHFFIVDGSYLLFNLIYCLVFKYDFITTHTIIMFIFMNICLFIGTQDEESSRRRWLTAVLSHHRAYRSVHGGFNSWRAQTDRLWLNHKSHCLSVFLYSAPKSQLCYCWYTNTFCDCLLLLPHSVLGFPAWLDFYISF